MGHRESENAPQADAQVSKRSALLALLLLAPAPTVGVLFAMYLMPDTAVGKAIFTISKIWLLALPLLWAARIDRQRLRIPRLHRAGLLAGLITGLLIFAVIYGACLWVTSHGMIDAGFVSGKMQSLGLRTPMIYILGSLYWCIPNSLLEEYVWRWFVYTRAAALLGRVPAIFVSALLFTMHHVFALAVYFDWRITLLASAGVCIGGITWAWLYARYQNIYAAWISHILADAAIFLIGYQIAFGP